MQPIIPLDYPYPGSVTEIPTRNFLGLATHFAIASFHLGPDGFPIMLANAPETGGPAEWTWSEFTQGRPYNAIYYASRLRPDLVVSRGYSQFGTRYDLVHWNCEHYANFCHGLPVVSKQVQTVTAAALLGGLAFALAQAA